MIDQGRRKNIRAMERDILHRVFEFGDLNVAELMTHGRSVQRQPPDPWDELVRIVQDSGMSRVPVWQGSPDNIVDPARQASPGAGRGPASQRQKPLAEPKADPQAAPSTALCAGHQGGR